MGPYELLQRIVETLDRLGIAYLVTGSVAAMAYGEPQKRGHASFFTD